MPPVPLSNLICRKECWLWESPVGHTGKGLGDVSILGCVNGAPEMVLGLDKLDFNESFSFKSPWASHLTS